MNKYNATCGVSVLALLISLWYLCVLSRNDSFQYYFYFSGFDIIAVKYIA